MKPQKRHKPEEGINGDCFRTALACLLDMDRDEVPHFNDGNPHPQYWEMVDTWLKERGLCLFSIPFTGELQPLIDTMKSLNPGKFYMLAGKSPRGTSHQVVAFENTIVCDPAIDGGGLIGPCPDDNLFWVNILAGKIHSA